MVVVVAVLLVATVAVRATAVVVSASVGDDDGSETVVVAAAAAVSVTTFDKFSTDDDGDGDAATSSFFVFVDKTRFVIATVGGVVFFFLVFPVLPWLAVMTNNNVSINSSRTAMEEAEATLEGIVAVVPRPFPPRALAVI